MTDQELNELVDERQGAVAIQKELDKQIETCTEAIKAELIGNRGVRKVLLDEWVPQIVVQDRKTLSVTKLLSAGVPAETIELATEKKESISLRVNRRGEHE